MTTRQLITLASFSAMGVILAAYYFEFVGGFLPCKLCYWQRYPHFINILIFPFFYFIPIRSLIFIGMGSMFGFNNFGSLSCRSRAKILAGTQFLLQGLHRRLNYRSTIRSNNERSYCPLRRNSLGVNWYFYGRMEFIDFFLFIFNLALLLLKKRN